MKGNILVLLQYGCGESEFGSKGEALVGGLYLGIYCRYSTTHLVDLLAVGSSQHSLQRLRLQILHGRFQCRRHVGVLFLLLDLD